MERKEMEKKAYQGAEQELIELSGEAVLFATSTDSSTGG